MVAEAFSNMPLDRPSRRRPKRAPAPAADAAEADAAEAEARSPEEGAEVARRLPFQNMQWAVGTKGSGAPVHFHNTAWNQLFYGRKHWYLFPPSHNLMGNKQVRKNYNEQQKRERRWRRKEEEK